MTNELEIINREFSKGTQSFNFLGNYRIDNKTIKIEIKNDSYDFQSYARSYLFTDQGWEIIYSMPYNNIMVIAKEISNYNETECIKEFEIDEAIILDISKKILGIE